MNHFTFPRTKPEVQGVSSAAIIDFVTRIDDTIQYLHSFVLVRHGSVVAEGWWQPYRPETRHMLFSVSKSFTSSAVGLAVGEGRLSIDTPVIDFFPEDVPDPISPNLAAMKVRHLLSMSTGHQSDTIEQTMPASNPIRAFLQLPVAYKPGTYFAYNSGASFMLAAIVQKLAGQTLAEYLGPRLFAPLGIEDAVWDSHQNGVNFGGWGLNLKTEDIARFGQLYLQKGEWQGRQLLSVNWVEEATAVHILNDDDAPPDWKQGYGYQLWRCQPPDVYRGDGAFGQFCIVMPREDAVLAITAGFEDSSAILSLVWEKLLPAMIPAPLPDDPTSARTLEQILKDLTIKPAHGTDGSPLAEFISGKTYVFEPGATSLIPRDFGFDPNPAALHSVGFDFDANTMTYSLIDQQSRSHTLDFGRGVWVENTADLGLPTSSTVAASGAWMAANTFTLQLCRYETPFLDTLVFTFAEDQVIYNSVVNVSLGPYRRPTAIGRLS